VTVRGGASPSTDLPRGYWRWEPADEQLLLDRKSEGARHKAIARELGRTPTSIDNRVRLLADADKIAA
jgi:hypothetical protein